MPNAPMKLKVLHFLLPFLVLFMMPLSAEATSTILPEAEKLDQCPSSATEFNEFYGAYDNAEEVADVIGEEDLRNLMGCAIKYGYVKAWMVTFYVGYILEFLLGIAGLISVLMILLGSYYYIAGGISDDKEKGKTIVQYAILGLVITSVSWILVNIVLLAVTQ